jgi:hypothetical protein
MSEPSRPLRILIYGDDVNVREQVNLALGKRLHPELPELTYIDVATAPVVIPHWTRRQNPGSDLTSPCWTLSRPVITTTTTATTTDGPVEGYVR